MDILLLQLVAYIKAPSAGTAVALLADDLAIVILFLLVVLADSSDGQVAVLELSLNVFLLETGKINIQPLIGAVIPDVSTHQRVRGLAERSAEKRVIEKVIEQIKTRVSSCRCK